MAERTAFLFGTKRYLSNVSPAAPQGHTNIVWQSDGENISAHIADSGGGGGAVSSVFGRTGAVVSVLGDYPPAKLGTGTPSATNYLRGDGAWSAVDYSQITGKPAPGSFQTPWLQDVDADGFNLVDANSLRFRNANGERIRLYDSGGINHAFGVESGTMYQQVATNSVHRWYVGAAPDGGVSAKMELGGNLGLKNTSLVIRTYGAFVGFNAEYTDAWRYSSNGPAGVIMTLNNVFALYTAPPGTAGAVANVNPAFTDDGANFTLSRALRINSPAYVMGSNAFSLNAVYEGGWKYTGPGTNPAFGIYADPVSNRVTLMCVSAGAPGAAIAFPATAHIYQNAFQVMVPFFLNGLPTSPSGLASGGVWRDAAAGNVLKMVP